MEKEIWVEFSESAYNDYEELKKKVLEEKENNIENSFNMQLLKAIEREKDNLKINPQHGIHIPRKNISKATKERYGTDRLWKIDLVGYWRMIYPITGDKLRIISFIWNLWAIKNTIRYLDTGKFKPKIILTKIYRLKHNE